MELRNKQTYNESEFPSKVKKFIRDNWGELNQWYLYILMNSGEILEFIPNVEREMEWEEERRFFIDGYLDYYGPDIMLDPSNIKSMEIGDVNPFENINEYGRMQELAGLKQPEPRMGLSSTNQIEIGVFDSITSLPQLKSFLDERGSRGLLETIFKYYIGDEDLSDYTSQRLKEAIIEYWLEN